jgi:hypothetical protein
MQELLARALRQVANGSFSHPILEMRIDSAEGEFLLRLLARANKSSVRKSSVVAMVVSNFHTVLSGELFECTLGINGLGRGEIRDH